MDPWHRPQARNSRIVLRAVAPYCDGSWRSWGPGHGVTDSLSPEETSTWVVEGPGKGPRFSSRCKRDPTIAGG